MEGFWVVHPSSPDFATISAPEQPMEPQSGSGRVWPPAINFFTFGMPSGYCYDSPRHQAKDSAVLSIPMS